MSNGDDGVGALAALGCVGLGAVFVLLVLVFGAFANVGVGEVGIVKHWGAIDQAHPDVLAPGFNVKMPFRDDVVYFDTKVQRANVEKLQAASKDGITVTTDLAINFHIDPANAPLILQNVGSFDALRGNILSPAVTQAYKDVTGTYEALAMIQKRQELADKAKEVLQAKVRPYFLLIDAVSITNLEFPKTFDDALQQTQVANQNRLKAQQDQERTKIEAETARIQAEGLAAAQKAQAVSITEEYLRLQSIQKWDGKLPQYLTPGAAIPFIGTAVTAPSTPTVVK